MIVKIKDRNVRNIGHITQWRKDGWEHDDFISEKMSLYTLFQQRNIKRHVSLIRFATDVTKENASYRTLLSSLLETSSANYPTNKQMNEHLSELYGASFGSGTGKKGNQHF